jgi:hypothetical protein
MEIRLPKTTSDLIIRHYAPLMNEDYQQEITLEKMADFISEVSGISANKIKSKVHYQDLLKMFTHVSELYAGINPSSTPPKEVVYNGVTYELINPEKVGTGWHIDFGYCDIEKDPVQLACLFYYPKGSHYGEIDINDNLVHPIKDRYNIFADNMQLDTFISCCAFFLRNYEKSIRKFTVKEIAKQRTMMLIRKILMRGKKQLT